MINVSCSYVLVCSRIMLAVCQSVITGQLNCNRYCSLASEECSGTTPLLLNLLPSHHSLQCRLLPFSLLFLIKVNEGAILVSWALTTLLTLCCETHMRIISSTTHFRVCHSDGGSQVSVALICSMVTFIPSLTP